MLTMRAGRPTNHCGAASERMSALPAVLSLTPPTPHRRMHLSASCALAVALVLALAGCTASAQSARLSPFRLVFSSSYETLVCCAALRYNVATLYNGTNSACIMFSFDDISVNGATGLAFFVLTVSSTC